MASSLSNFVNNLSEGIKRIKCKLRYDDKRCEKWEIKYKHCGCFLESTNFKDDLIEYKWKFDEILKERFLNVYKYSNHDNNKFILLLQKGIFPYEYMDNWEKFNETLLPGKKCLQSLKYGRYYWFSLCAQKKSFLRF